MKIDEFENYIEINFPSKSSNISFARNAIAAFASQLDFTYEQILDIKTVVSEIVTNCVIHAYSDVETPDSIVKIFSGLKDDYIEITIKDTGVGIENVELAKETLFTTKKGRSGMGFTIVDEFCDFLDIKSKLKDGTEVTIRKKV